MKLRPICRRGLACLLILGAMAGSTAHGHDPNKPIKVFVPYAAGGQADLVAWLVGQQSASELGQSFVVDNRPGAGGTIAVEAFIKSAADGYTLLIADAAQWAINPAQQPQPYDVQRDLVPIAKVTTSSLFLAAHQSVPAKDLQELVALAKREPGKLTYGSSGVGTVHHLSMETFKAALGLDIVHVPYRGTAQSMPALAGGHTSLAITGDRDSRRSFRVDRSACSAPIPRRDRSSPPTFHPCRGPEYRTSIFQGNSLFCAHRNASGHH